MRMKLSMAAGLSMLALDIEASAQTACPQTQVVPDDWSVPSLVACLVEMQSEIAALRDQIASLEVREGDIAAFEDAVVAFAATGCPPGWRQFEQANGRMIVGIDGRQEYAVTFPRGNPIFATGGEEEVTLEVENLPFHSHYLAVINLPTPPNQDQTQGHPVVRGMIDSSGNVGDLHDTGIRTLHELWETYGRNDVPVSLSILPPYVALYWCTPEAG